MNKVKCYILLIFLILACSPNEDEDNNIEENITSFVSESLTEEDKVGLIWNDEFEGQNLDLTKWNIQTGDGTDEGVPGWGNQEEQTYTDRNKNLKIKDGFLIISAFKENYLGKSYTSARINTQDKFSFQYGRIETRVKLPKSKGTWPALWLLGENHSTVGWPRCGEIDFIEQFGQEKDKVITATHWFNEESKSNAMYSKKTSIPSTSDEFIKYKLTWDQTAIRIYIEGDKAYEIALNETLPFDQPFFLLINLAMGGTNGGATSSNFIGDDFYIDYIRVYEN